MNAPFHPPQAANGNGPYRKWTDEEREHVKQLLRDGCSGSQVGDALGLSKNAVIGRIHRDPELREIGFTRGPGENHGVNRGKAKTEAPPRPKPRRVSKPRLPFVFVSRPEPEPPSSAPDPLNLPLLDLTEHTCKWPVSGEKANTLFCGQEARGLGPYCPYHKRIAWRGAA